ncbi:MAG: pitrilysin family protein, partial [Pseudomonadota bacterium]
MTHLFASVWARPSLKLEHVLPRGFVRQAFALGAILVAATAMTVAPTHTKKAFAVEIQEVTSPGGISAWLVEDHSLPLMAMQFAFEGGAAQDGSGKAGTASLLTALMDEGAGDLKAAEFQAKVEDLAMRMSYDASRDTFSGSFQSITANRADSIELLRLALTSPRFDDDAIERMRASTLSSLASAAKNPSSVAAKVWYETAFPDHPYARPVRGTIETVQAITAQDLRDYHQRVFNRETLKVGVVGDITASELGALLDTVFGGLPAKAQLAQLDKTELKVGDNREITVTSMPIPQSVAVFGTRGVLRDDPDFVPAYVLNYILGGGSFSSWLMQEVREKRGLAYSVYSYLAPLENAGLLLGGVATRNDAIGESIDLIEAQLQRMRTNGPTPEELDGAIRHL